MKCDIIFLCMQAITEKTKYSHASFFFFGKVLEAEKKHNDHVSEGYT